MTLTTSLQTLNRKLDWSRRPRPGVEAPPVVVYAVYRQRNAEVLSALLSSQTVEAHLWALDNLAPSLGHWTRGQGPGGKFELINRLLQDHQAPDAHRVVADDDFAFTRGGLNRFVAYQAAFGFGLAQPAHSMDSRHEHHITKVRPRVTARETSFVEIGPVFSVAPGAPGVLPFPEDAGMGWGLEATWATTPGLRIGIIDAVTIKHLGPVGTAYDMTEAARGHDKRLAEAGVGHITDIMKDKQTFYRVPRRSAARAR